MTNQATSASSNSRPHLRALPPPTTGPLPACSIVYLAGPMTGIPDYNRPAFNTAASTLEQLGFTVINPARVQLRPGANWQDYMRQGLRGVSNADAVIVLPGWDNSRGAKAEVAAAKSIDIPIYQLTEITTPEPPK